jgi:polyisoprenoid-binding protein YceI
MKSRAFALLLSLISVCAFAASRPIDTARSKITIHVGKSGLFSAAGHEHEVSAPIAEGAIDDSGPGHAWFRVETARMTVLPEKDRDAVQSAMQQQVLQSDRFPQIRFESSAIQKLGDDKWTVTGALTLHGETHPVTVDVRRDANGFAGETRIKQTQFGIQPPSAAGGTVKAKDELKITFLIVLQH